MTEITVKVLKQLKGIFPNIAEDLLLCIIDNPDNRTGLLTEDTLVVRCVEQILEGEEAAERRLKNSHVDKTDKKTTNCNSVTEVESLNYRDHDQASNDDASIACCSDLSVVESHHDISQSPKSSSSFGISTLTIDLRDENKEGPRLGYSEGHRGVRMKDWLEKCGPKKHPDTEHSDGGNSLAETNTGPDADIAVVLDESSLDGQATLTASLEAASGAQVRENPFSPGPSFDECSNSEFEIISLGSTDASSRNSWSVDSQVDRCVTPCNEHQEDSLAKSTNRDKDGETSDTDTVTVEASQDTECESLPSLDSPHGSGEQNLHSVSNSSGENSVVSVSDGTASDSILDSNTPLRSKDSVFNISDIVELESPMRRRCFTDSGFSSAEKESRSAGVTADPLDLSHVDEDSDLDSVIFSGERTSPVVQNVEEEPLGRCTSSSKESCKTLISANSGQERDSTSELDRILTPTNDANDFALFRAITIDSVKPSEKRSDTDCAVTSSDIDLPGEPSPCSHGKDSSDTVCDIDDPPVQSLQISSNSADSHNDTHDLMSDHPVLKDGTKEQKKSENNEDKNKLLMGIKKHRGVKKSKPCKKHNQFSELSDILSKSCAAIIPMLKNRTEFKSQATETLKSNAESKTTSLTNNLITLSDIGLSSQKGKTTKDLKPESDMISVGPSSEPGQLCSQRLKPVSGITQSMMDAAESRQPELAQVVASDESKLTANRTRCRAKGTNALEVMETNRRLQAQVDSSRALLCAAKEKCQRMASVMTIQAAKQRSQAEVAAVLTLNNAANMRSRAEEKAASALKDAASTRSQAQQGASLLLKDLEREAITETANRRRQKIMAALATGRADISDFFTVKAPSSLITEKAPNRSKMNTSFRKRHSTPSEMGSSISSFVSGHIHPVETPTTTADLTRLPGLDSSHDIQSSLEQVTAIFPDVDKVWLRMELRQLKARYPEDFLQHLCSTMADNGYQKVGGHPSSAAVEKAKGKGKHKSVNVKGSLEKIKSSQRYVDVLSEIGEEAEEMRRLQQKRPLEEAMDITDPVPRKIPVMTDGTDSHLAPVPDLDESKDSASDSVFRLQCEACDMLASTTNLTQCCDGHLLCKGCVEKCVKSVMSKDTTTIVCPLKQCNSEIRLADARKVLPQFVVDLLQERIEKQERNSINKMHNVVSCPDCGMSVIMEALDKQFHCPNTDCMLACCRYCKRPWNEGKHDYCSPLLSVPSLENCTRYPDHWDVIDPEFDQEYMKVVVSRDSVEFMIISEMFNRSMHKHTITCLTRIQNPKLWQKYGLTRSHILEDFGPQKLNENHLFHGTNPAVVDSICKEGFDWRLCGQHGVAHGHGSYFAVDAHYSHNYALTLNRSFGPLGIFGGNQVQNAFPTSHLLMVARVICGRYTLGTHNMRRPPVDPSDPKQRPFNSTVNNVTRPTMYVTYDRSQTYPEYVIEYM